MASEVIRKEPLSKKERNQCWWRYLTQCNNCSNNVNWFGNIWPYTLYPFFKKFYNNEGMIERMQAQSDMYNSESIFSTLTYGIMLSMEEEKALKGNVSDEIIRTTKASLMGPLAGIGDSAVQGTIIPLLLSLAISMTAGGSVLGPIFYLIAVPIILVAISKFLFDRGYTLGRSAVSMLASGNMQRITEAVSLFGVTVIGTLASTYLLPKTILAFETASGNNEATVVSLQAMIDKIYPNLLGLLLVFVCYFFLRKKKVSMLKLILGMMAAIVVLAYIGIV